MTYQPSNPLPILYSFRRCPYAMRARLALCYAQQAVELREIVLRAKPAEMLAISPKGTVPVLQLPDGQVIEQSLEVMQWALQQHDPLDWWPTHPDVQADIRAFIAENDGAFKAALDRYKYPNRYPEQNSGQSPEQAALLYRSQGEQFLAQLDARLTQQRYLCADQISLADVAIFPFVRQFAQVDRAWFDQADYPHVQAWLAEWLDSRLFAQVMQKFQVWQSGTLGTVFAADFGVDCGVDCAFLS